MRDRLYRVLGLYRSCMGLYRGVLYVFIGGMEKKMEATSSGSGRCLLHVKGTFSKAPRSIARGQGAAYCILVPEVLCTSRSLSFYNCPQKLDPSNSYGQLDAEFRLRVYSLGFRILGVGG